MRTRIGVLVVVVFVVAAFVWGKAAQSDRGSLAGLVAGRPDLAEWLIGELARRVREAEEQLENAMLRDQPSRVVNALLRLSQSSEGTNDGSPTTVL